MMHYMRSIIYIVMMCSKDNNVIPLPFSWSGLFQVYLFPKREIIVLASSLDPELLLDLLVLVTQESQFMMSFSLIILEAISRLLMLVAKGINGKSNRI
jgi:hypothetical protein